MIKANPLKRWKISEIDKKAIEKWDEYTTYKEKMMEVTDRNNAPWIVVDSNKIEKAHITAMEYVLSQITYK